MSAACGGFLRTVRWLDTAAYRGLTLPCEHWETFDLHYGPFVALGCAGNLQSAAENEIDIPW